MQNIDIFNAVAMEVFHKCLVKFPQPVEIETATLTHVVIGYFEKPDEHVDINDLFQDIDYTVHETIVWLKHEGFLKDKGSTAGSFVVVLSQKGLNAINATPKVLESKKPFKDYFIQGLTSLPFSTVSGVMVEFFKIVG